MSDNIEKVNDLLIGNYEYNYVTSSNALRKVRKKSNEKKINFEIKNWFSFFYWVKISIKRRNYKYIVDFEMIFLYN